ncbi:MAG: MarR family transcriptional regulator [Ilumatobacteraceae bacterium]|nr:MarR family transcriptional regulator [Ilumatobacteraceae bacterium]
MSGRWLDDREQAVWRGFLQMQAQLFAKLNRSLAGESGISEGDYAVLASLSETEGGRMRAFQLARDLQWEKSRLSHQLTRMERRGMIERQECPTDARGAFIAITETGSAAIREAAPLHVADVRRWFIDLLDDGQLTALSGITSTVLAALGEPPLPSDCPGAAEAAADVEVAVAD